MRETNAWKEFNTNVHVHVYKQTRVVTVYVAYFKCQNLYMYVHVLHMLYSCNNSQWSVNKIRIHYTINTCVHSNVKNTFMYLGATGEAFNTTWLGFLFPSLCRGWMRGEGGGAIRAT